MKDDIKKELDKIVASDHHDPFQVLGFHRHAAKPRSSVIRTFQPLADAMYLVTNGEKIPMNKTRKEGLYELVFPNCTDPFDYDFEASYHDGTVHTYKDPYRFLPQLTDYDCHLFNSGTHYEIYDKLGAHLETIDGIKGTIFRVWAPDARRVSVLGNFNYWDGRVHPMRARGASGPFPVERTAVPCNRGWHG